MHFCAYLAVVKFYKSFFMSKSVYVADLPFNYDEKGNIVPGIDTNFLRTLFKDYGVVTSPDGVQIMVKEKKKGNSSVFAFIEFESEQQARRAIEDLNYTKIQDIPIRLITNNKKTKEIINSKQGNLCITNLSPAIEVSQIYEVFSQYGEILTCKIPFEIINDPERRVISCGYAYVQFLNPNDANTAMEDLQGSTIFGDPIKIEQFVKLDRPNPETSFTNCYIKNIPSSYTDDDLRALFSEFGEVVSSKVSTDSSGKSQNFGFCSMKTHEQALNAIESINGRIIEGKEIECCRMKKKKERLNELRSLSESWKRENSAKYKGRNLYVRNFDETVVEGDLEAAFGVFGPIENVAVMRDDSGNSKKFGFVCFADRKSAENCLARAQPIVLHGRSCFVAEAVSKEERMKKSLARSGVLYVSERKGHARTQYSKSQQKALNGGFEKSVSRRSDAGSLPQEKRGAQCSRQKSKKPQPPATGWNPKKVRVRRRGVQQAKSIPEEEHERDESSDDNDDVDDDYDDNSDDFKL